MSHKFLGSFAVLQGAVAEMLRRWQMGRKSLGSFAESDMQI